MAHESPKCLIAETKMAVLRHLFMLGLSQSAPFFVSLPMIYGKRLTMPVEQADEALGPLLKWGYFMRME